MGDGLIVLFWHVGREIGEGVDGSISGNQDIRPSHYVGKNFRLFDFIQHFVDLYQLIVVLLLQGGFELIEEGVLGSRPSLPSQDAVVYLTGFLRN